MNERKLALAAALLAAPAAHAHFAMSLIMNPMRMMGPVGMMGGMPPAPASTK